MRSRLMPEGSQRVQVQVLLADLTRSYAYLQISDQLLAAEPERHAQGDDEETQQVLGRVGVATTMLDRSCRDLLEQVTGVSPGPSSP